MSSSQIVQRRPEGRPSGAGWREDGYLPIGDYAAIGNGGSVCLVGLDGAIDWMAAPRIDSPPVLAALLDPERGGRFVLAPEGPFEASRSYAPRTNVLRTTFVTPQGAAQVTDAVAIAFGRVGPSPELVRRVEGMANEVRMRWSLELPSNDEYGGWETSRTPGGILATRGPLQLVLTCWDAGEVTVGDGTAEAWVTLREGEQATFVLQCAEDETLTVASREQAHRRLQETAEVWRASIAGHRYDGPWRDAVERSLLAIELLSDVRCGAIAAAATNSLPEVLGGERNYDYRFAWVRDLSFALESLLAVGIEEPTGRALNWLLTATRATHPRVDPVYTLAGEVLRSQRSTSLPGYRGTRPVHAGNQAGSQLQLGGFGDLIEAVANYTRQGHLLPNSVGERLADTGNLLCAIWRRPDAGLWELGERADYASSKFACWTAFHRLLELAAAGHVPDRHAARWRREREAVRAFIDERLWSDEKGTFLMRPDSDALDCAVLLGARRGLIEPHDPRLAATIEAIERELDAGEGFLYRYSGMREEENAFVSCSFWLAEALAIAGRGERAAETFQAALSACNDVGLCSEEINPRTKELRGNFPQALTHLSLIRAAVAIADAPG